ncbi:hypothetical protein ACIPRD_11075 [Streptomyces sp. NPDC090108]|uniref:hypothetical protein n=1 Tax=Streptomyces sp. NPDC090108 TaxID=3365947 RepID=UPI0037F7892F
MPTQASGAADGPAGAATNESTPVAGTAGAAPTPTPRRDEAGAAPDADADSGPYRVTVLDLGRFTVAAVTVIAALVGLVLGIRAEQRAGADERRTDATEQREKESREKSYADLVDFYRTDSGVIVVNGSSRVMDMRLTLPASRLTWDLDLQRPCKQVDIPNRELLDSMAGKQPSVRLTEADLAQLRLEFKDPAGRVWIRSSGGPLARLDTWRPSRLPNRADIVNSEKWNARAEDAPQCGAS